MPAGSAERCTHGLARRIWQGSSASTSRRRGSSPERIRFCFALTSSSLAQASGVASLCFAATLRKRTELGAPVPLTGRYAVQGAAVRAGLELWAGRSRRRLVLLDDRSSPEGAVRAYDELLRRGCEIVLGPYGSDCVRAVARAHAGALVWNHGGAADDVQLLPGVVSICSPASRYLVVLGRAVARLNPGATVAAPAARGRFAAYAREALEREARTLGLTLVPEPTEADAVLLCGPLEWELERIRALDRSKLIGAVSPGLASFDRLLGPVPGAEGLLAPVQWHPDLGGPREARGVRSCAGLCRSPDRRELPRPRVGAETAHADVLRCIQARPKRPPNRSPTVSRPLAPRAPRLLLPNAG